MAFSYWLLNPVKENQARMESKVDRLEGDFRRLETGVKTDFKRLEGDFKRLETEVKADFRRLEGKIDQFLSFQKT